MKGSDFIFDCVHCYTTNFKRGGSYIHSADLMKNKKAAINTINKKDNKCFQYDVTVALNHEEIKKDLQRITKIKPFTDTCMWEGINYTSEKDDQKRFEKNSLMIILYVFMLKTKYILPMIQNKT